MQTATYQGLTKTERAITKLQISCRTMRRYEERLASLGSQGMNDAFDDLLLDAEYVATRRRYAERKLAYTAATGESLASFAKHLAGPDLDWFKIWCGIR